MVSESLRSTPYIDDITSRIILEQENIQPAGYEPEHGYPFFKDENGRKLYLVVEEPAQQLLGSMLMGNFINHCQVLFDKQTGHFYSNGVEEAGEQEGFDEDENKADQFVLAALFGIYDRDFSSEWLKNKNKSATHGRMYHYDIAPRFQFGDITQGEAAYFQNLTPTAQDTVLAKLEKFKKSYQGEEGGTLIAAIYNRALACSKASKRNTNNAYHRAPLILGPATRKYSSMLGHINYNLSIGHWEIANTRDFQERFLQRIDNLIKLGGETLGNFG